MASELILPKDKHTSGSVRELLVIALPMMISQGFETIMMFVDRLFLSRLEHADMNAAMGGGLTAFVSMSFFFGIIGYTNALVATHIGAGKKSRATLAVTQSLILSILAYPLLLLLIPFGETFFARDGTSSAQLVSQVLYFKIMMFGTIIGMARHALSSFFGGIGKTGIVMVSSLVAMLVNILLNYILIFGHFGFPALGIKGAAIGTIAGGTSGLIVLVVKYLSRRNRAEYNIRANLRFDLPVFKKLLRYGAPSGAEIFLNMLAFSLFLMEFHSYGLGVASAATITFNWDMLAFIPTLGLGVGVMSLVGRYMGANNPDAAHRATMSGMKIITFYASFMFLIFLLFPAQLVGVFCTPDTIAKQPETMPLAIFMVQTITIYVFADALANVFGSALRGAGDTFWTMVISVGGHWVMVVVSVILVRYVKATPRTVWMTIIGLLLWWSAMLFLRYRSGKWRKMRILQPHGGEEPASDCFGSGVTHS